MKAARARTTGEAVEEMQRLSDWLTTPPPFDPLVMLVLVVLAILGTIGFAAWFVLAREEPDLDDAAPLRRITARDEQAARRVQEELDREAGRSAAGASAGGRPENAAGGTPAPGAPASRPTRAGVP